MQHLFEITLKSVKVLEDGFAREGTTQGENLISFNLIAPKEGVSSLETVKKAKLVDGKVYNFNEKAFSDRFLFKTTIQGNASLVVEISAKEKTFQFEKVIKAMFKASLLAATALITGGVGATLAVATIKAGVGSVFDVEDKKEKLRSIGKGEFPINFDTKETKKFKIQLAVPKRIKLFTGKDKADGTPKHYFLKKGIENGEVVLEIKKYPIGKS